MASVVNTTSFFFQQLIGEVEALSWASNDKKAVRQKLAENFHRHIGEVLSQSEAGDLMRRQSVAIVQDWSDAESLLAEGVEGYVQVVRKLLATDLDDNVEIAYKDLDYIARTPVLSENTGYSTVASQLFDIVLGPCFFAGRTVRNLVSGGPALEYVCVSSSSLLFTSTFY